MDIPQENKKRLYTWFSFFIIILSLYFLVKLIGEVRNYQSAPDMANASTITLTGHGEVNAAPDVATIDFTIRKDGKTVKEAQDAVAAVEKTVLDALSKDNVAQADVKTTNASFNPTYRYTYSTVNIPCPAYNYCPPPANSVISGYEAYESIEVKVRDIDNAGTVMQSLGSAGVESLSGPNFTIDKPDALKDQARQQAIDDAQSKASELAKELHVRLGKVSSFSENGGYPMPIMYAKDMAAGASASAPAALPAGENTVTSDVTITYQIR